MEHRSAASRRRYRGRRRDCRLDRIGRHGPGQSATGSCVAPLSRDQKRTAASAARGRKTPLPAARPGTGRASADRCACARRRFGPADSDAPLRSAAGSIRKRRARTSSTAITPMTASRVVSDSMGNCSGHELLLRAVLRECRLARDFTKPPAFYHPLLPWRGRLWSGRHPEEERIMTSQGKRASCSSTVGDLFTR